MFTHNSIGIREGDNKIISTGCEDPCKVLARIHVGDLQTILNSSQIQPCEHNLFIFFKGYFLQLTTSEHQTLRISQQIQSYYL